MLEVEKMLVGKRNFSLGVAGKSVHETVVLPSLTGHGQNAVVHFSGRNGGSLVQKVHFLSTTGVILFHS